LHLAYEKKPKEETVLK